MTEKRLAVKCRSFTEHIRYKENCQTAARQNYVPGLFSLTPPRTISNLILRKINHDCVFDHAYSEIEIS